MEFTMESSDINKVRGKLLFWKTIEDSDLPEKMMDRAKELGKGFEDLVGVSAYDGLYPAKRLAEAILEVSTWDYDHAGFDLGPDQVIKYYNDKLSDKHPVAIKSSNYVPSGAKLDGAWGREVTSEADDFEKQIRLAALAEDQEEIIDLLDDVMKSELSTEGQRKTGIISSIFDTTKDTVQDLTDEENIMGRIWFTDSGEIERVECPYCTKSDAYPIRHDTFGCFVCDQTFKVPMEMGDTL
jgi:hypothetical protein